MSFASWVNNNIFGGGVSGPPGALTGPPPSEGGLIRNPDGSATDPVTGQTYAYIPPSVSPTGISSPGHYMAQGTPNVAQQVGTNSARAGGFYSQVPGYDQREAQAYGQEQGVANLLNSIAMGSGPTVAGAQLAAGNDQAVRSQLAAAGGASGNNAALARLAATGNMGQLQAQTNQQQALARVGEQSNAIGRLAGVTSDMTQQSGNMAGQKIGAGNALSQMAMGGEEAREGLTEDANKAQAQNNQNSMNKVFNGAGALLSML